MSSQHPVDEKGLDDKAITSFVVLPRLINQYELYHLQKGKTIMQCICMLL